MRMTGWAVAAWLLTQMPVAMATEETTVVESTNTVERAAQAVPPPTALTRHVIRIGGREIAYQAAAGTLVIDDAKGRPDAAMFYVGYTAEGVQDPSTRPLTFLFNGGPGSSSIWLHLGSIGPVRVHTADAEATGPAPYRWQDNPHSLLDRTDLVFVDAIGTGYSHGLPRAEDGDADPGRRFWGTGADIDAFARFVQRYLSEHRRWNSPKFLFGESYGTVRAAGLVRRLQDLGIETNGVVLMSSILNFGARLPGFDHEYVHTLPTFAAIAWHHGRVEPAGRSQAAFLDEVRRFARGPYAEALSYGHTLEPERVDEIAGRLAAYTGLTADVWKASSLRVGIPRFRSELLRERRLSVGRYDGRFLGLETDAVADGPDSDASSTAILGAYTAAFNDYVGGTLGYRPAAAYKVKAPLSRQWDWKYEVRGAQGPMLPVPVPVMLTDLADAMRANPRLKVLSANGWYDLSTPFSASEYDLAHLAIDERLRANIRFTYYPAGHMMYLEPGSLVQLKQNLAEFYDEALAR